MSMRRELKGAFTIWYRDVLRFVTDRPRIIASFGQPLLFLFIFGSGIASAMSGLGGGAIDFRQFMFPGILGMSVLFAAVFSALSIVWDREFGFLKEVMVAPVSRLSVGLGKVAGGSTVAMFQGTFLLLLAPLIGIKLSFSQIVQLMGLMLLLAAVMTSFGILMASRQKSMEGFQMVMNFLLMPMLFLSGAFFPITSDLPDWLEFLARIDPVSYGVDPLRQVMLRGEVPPQVLDQLTLYSIPVDIAIMVGFGVAFLVPAIWLFSKSD